MDAKRNDYPGPGYAAYVVAVLLLIGITSYLDRNVISLLVEPMKRDLLLSDTQISVLQGTAFALFFVVLGLPFGYLADRVDRRRLLAFGICLWSVMTITCAVAQNFWQLFFARAGVGIGEACLAPAAFSIIADYFRPERRGRAMSTYNMANYLGGSASLLIGGLVLQVLGGTGSTALPGFGATANWKIVFLVAGLPGFLLALLVLTLREPPRRVDPRINDGGRSLAPGVEMIRAGTAKLFAAVYFVSAMTAFSGYVVASWGPTLVIRRLGFQPSRAGLILGSISAVCGIAGCLVSGVLGDRLAASGQAGGRFAIPLLWLPLALLSALGMGLAPDRGFVFIAYGIFMFGSGLGLASVVPSLHDIVPADYRGRSTALHFVFSGLIGQTLAPTLVALATDRVFHDPAKLGMSMVLVLVPVTTISFIVCWSNQRSFQAVTREFSTKPSD